MSESRTDSPIGPMRVGGRYLCGYWQQEYTVLAVNGAGTPCWSVTVRWADGRTTSHCTEWDAQRDRIVAQPADEPCPCRDCRAAPVIPLAPSHAECCGQLRRAPWCPR